MTPSYDLGKIRTLLTEGFSAEELRTLIFDAPSFKPVHHLLAHNTGKAEIVSRLLVHAEQTRQLDRLLELAKEANPVLYVRYEPYGYDHTAASSPYPGMHYFDVSDAARFFGRAMLTAKLVGRLTPTPSPILPLLGGGSEDRGCFLAVVGASGSGKSSVVRAGVVPALQCGQPLADGSLPPEGSSRWPIHIITPTAHPLESLAASLTREAESVTATATLLDDMGRDSRSLHLYARKLLTSSPTLPLLGGGSRLLLVVDQFEELFTLCRNEAERRAFIDNLLTAAGAPSPVAGEGWGGGDGPTLVVLTLRADFYAHCAQYEHLREALARYQEYIGPMSAEELRRAIELPAQQTGCEFEAGLVDLILRDVGDEPGALPLLSHALLETWRRRAGQMMTLAGYAESGGVRGAIAKTAQSVFERLTSEQQAVARRIFLRLTELGEGTQDTRRRVSLAELTPRPGEETTTEPVLKVLTDARLVTTDEEAVEVAHEALIREWPTLRQWLNDNREGLRLHRQLSEAVQEWQRMQCDPGGLYRGAKLAQASEWAEQHPAELNAVEWEFLTTSKQAEENERLRELEQARALAEAERQRAEAEQQRVEEQAQANARLRQRAIWVAAAGVVALMLAIVAVVFGLQANENAKLAAAREAEAKQQADVVTAHRLAAEGRLLFEEKPLLGLRLAMEGWALSSEYDQIDQFIREMMQQGRLLTLGQGDVEDIYAKRDNPLVFILDRVNAPGELRRTVDGALVATLTGSISGVIFSPDWSYFVVYYDDGTPPELRRTADGTIVVVLSDRLDNVTFSPYRAANYFAVDYDDGMPSSELRRCADGKVIVTLSGLVSDITFSPDEAQTYFFVKYLYDLPSELRRSSDGKVVSLSGPVSDVVFSWDEAGTYFVVIYKDDAPAELRRSADNKVIATLPGLVSYVIFTPDETGIVVFYKDDTPVELRHSADGQVITILSNRASLGFSPDEAGTYFVVAYGDGAPGELRRSADGQVIATLSGSLSSGESVTFSPDKDGTYFVVHYSDSTPDELRHSADGQIITTLPGSGDHLAFSPDEVGTYFFIHYSGDEPPSELRRSADGKIIAILALASFAPDVTFSPNGTYFFVDYHYPTLGELRRSVDGKVITTLSGPLFNVTFSPDQARTYFIVRFDDDQNELWQTENVPHRLIKLGLNLKEYYFDVAGDRLIVQYRDRRAYLLDLVWLRAMGGKAEGMPIEELVRIACEGPFASGLFNEAELKPYLGEREPQACK